METKVIETYLVFAYEETIRDATENFTIKCNKLVESGWEPLNTYKWTFSNGYHYFTQQYVKRAKKE